MLNEDKQAIIDYFNFEPESLSLNFISEPIFTYPRFFVIKKNSLVVDKFSKIIEELLEHGFIDHWTEMYQPDPILVKPARHRPTPLALHNILGISNILIGGWSLAFVVFVIEYFFKQISKKSIVLEYNKEKKKKHSLVNKTIITH